MDSTDSMLSPTSRINAGLRHLLASLLATIAVTAGLVWLWYPLALWSLAGITQATWLLLAAVAIAPPLMTFAVYRPGKKGLWADIGVILALQLAFLAFGVVTLARARPVFLVAAVDRFELVRAAELAPEDLARGQRPEFRTAPWTGPRVVGVMMPTAPDEQYELIMSGLSGKDVQYFPKYYTDYATSAPGILGRSKPLDTLVSRSQADQATIAAALQKAGRRQDTTRFVPINGTAGAATMLIDSGNGGAIAPVDVYPWTDLKPGTKH